MIGHAWGLFLCSSAFSAALYAGRAKQGRVLGWPLSYGGGTMKLTAAAAPAPSPCSLTCQVDVLVEMKDATTVIPRNSLIEANQSGLIAEPLIDITPQAPVPQYKGAGAAGWQLLLRGPAGTAAVRRPMERQGSTRPVCGQCTAPGTRRCVSARHRCHSPPPCASLPAANPLDEDCEKEGLVVCHQGRIRGERGTIHCRQRLARTLRSGAWVAERKPGCFVTGQLAGQQRGPSGLQAGRCGLQLERQLRRAVHLCQQRARVATHARTHGLPRPLTS